MKKKSITIKTDKIPTWKKVGDPSKVRFNFECKECKSQKIVDIYSLTEGGVPFCDGTDEHPSCEGEDMPLISIEVQS